MQTKTKLENIDPATCVVKATHRAKGRTISVAPGQTASRNLFYGRIILESGDGPVAFETNGHETGLICLNGSGTVSTGGESFQMKRYDALYVPRDSKVEITSDSGFDLAELSSPVEKQYPLQFVAFDEIRQDSALHFVAGKPPTERDLNILIGKNVEAGRIMAGVTFSSDGNWTSWPPHEHENMLEEAYLYIDMPAPQWGVQFVYTNARGTRTRSGSARGRCGYHAPGLSPECGRSGRFDQLPVDDGRKPRRCRPAIRRG